MIIDLDRVEEFHFGAEAPAISLAGTPRAEARGDCPDIPRQPHLTALSTRRPVSA